MNVFIELIKAGWFYLTGDMPSEEERLKRIKRNWDRLDDETKKKYFDKTKTVEIVRLAKGEATGTS